MMVEGNSLRSSARVADVSLNTVTKFLVDLGMACEQFHDEHVRNVRVRRLQCDEIWCFVGAKAKNVTPEQKAQGWGDTWTWTGICADSKLCVSYLVGGRSADWAMDFMLDCAARIRGRVQVTTDGHKAYLEAVEEAFGADVAYAQLQKIYGAPSDEETRRYSPARCIGCELKVVSGDLDFTIDVPPNADPGSHWGGVVVRTGPVPAGGGAAIQTRVGTIVLFRVAGEAKEKLALESVSVPGFLESPPIELEARFKNEGTVHEAPQGTIEVRNMFGWLAATGTLPVRNVWPGDVRKIDATVGEGLWLGRYSVLFRATYGDGKNELVARRIIWVVPWRTQGWKVLLGIAVLALVIWKRRNFGEGMVRTADGEAASRRLLNFNRV